ncbi:hypothetical protein FPQ18DRAFT_398760 [Pyronema domesticum]|nr:hypothetical protein FPQ18DRAFT_398760 [Pyronema domesticum]
MGIPGLYAELGAGERISLAKYAAEHHARTGRRLRIAVDASIWAFQVQAGKGGNNPALRTVYYRLLRLISHNITPIFIFDGPHRPGFKRGSQKNTLLTPALIRLSKKLLKLFGCPFHTAPGEAEAECALLNREGIVDAVLSEDVDTLMFGASTVIRKWSGEGKAATPTHVSVYNSDSIINDAGLTREGIVLVAMMKGGDYLPEGVPGCGIKTAVEAAKAGAGKSLFEVRDDEEGLKKWRDRLAHEMSTNESKWFKRKNGKAVVPEDFPNTEILGWYAEPMVSSPENVERLRAAIDWNGKLDVAGLREYTRDTFEWRGTLGANKFVRTLAPVALAFRMWDQDTEIAELISAFHGRRQHASTDLCNELRLSYTPVDIVPINKTLEEEDDAAEAQEQAGVLEDDDAALMNDGEGGKSWDPYVAERIWILESFVARCMPDRITEYDSGKTKARPKSKAATKAPAAPRGRKATIPAPGAQQYLKVSKNTANTSTSKNLSPSPLSSKDVSPEPTYRRSISKDPSPEPTTRRVSTAQSRLRTVSSTLNLRAPKPPIARTNSAPLSPPPPQRLSTSPNFALPRPNPQRTVSASALSARPPRTHLSTLDSLAESRPGTPVRSRQSEVIDLCTPSPFRPVGSRTTSLGGYGLPSLSTAEIPWIRSSSPKLRGALESATRPKTPPIPASQTSPGLRRVASGKVAALVRNLETIAIREGSTLATQMPETPRQTGRKVDFESVVESPNITVRRRRKRTPAADGMMSPRTEDEWAWSPREERGEQDLWSPMPERGWQAPLEVDELAEGEEEKVVEGIERLRVRSKTPEETERRISTGSIKSRKSRLSTSSSLEASPPGVLTSRSGNVGLGIGLGIQDAFDSDVEDGVKPTNGNRQVSVTSIASTCSSFGKSETHSHHSHSGFENAETAWESREEKKEELKGLGIQQPFVSVSVASWKPGVWEEAKEGETTTGGLRVLRMLRWWI